MICALSLLLYRCETWTLNNNLKRWIHNFDKKNLWTIMKCCWRDHVLNPRVLLETNLRPVTCIVRQRQLQFSWQVARRSCSSRCICKIQSWVETKRTPTSLVAGESSSILARVVPNGKEGLLVETSGNGAGEWVVSKLVQAYHWSWLINLFHKSSYL